MYKINAEINVNCLNNISSRYIVLLGHQLLLLSYTVWRSGAIHKRAKRFYYEDWRYWCWKKLLSKTDYNFQNCKKLICQTVWFLVVFHCSRIVILYIYCENVDGSQSLYATKTLWHILHFKPVLINALSFYFFCYSEQINDILHIYISCIIWVHR